ncbi:MAG: (2Fe-2S)-binding protein [Janthinobacterium lividum]
MAWFASQSRGNTTPDLREAELDRGLPLAFTFDGAPVRGYAGESVAAALLATGLPLLRRSPREGAPRGAFCWMGICQECTVVIDGHRRPACRTPVTQNLTVLSGTIA